MDPTLAGRLRASIRNVPDFPKPGIVFRDITTFLLQPSLLREATRELWVPFQDQAEVVVGIESRGFILAAAMAVAQQVPFVPMRKPGKLPAATESVEYALEYGTDRLEMHRDAIAPGAMVLILDDVLATGGTAAAVAKLVDRLGGVVVGLGFVIELDFLHGRDKLAGREVFSLLHY